MADKKGSAPAGSRPGLISRLFRFTVYSAGFLVLFGLIDTIATAQLVKGRWQSHAPELTTDSVDVLVEKAEKKVRDRGDQPRWPKLNEETRSALATLGNRLASAISRQVQLEINDGGYRLEGLEKGQLVAAAMGKDSKPGAVAGCMTGSYVAAWPIIRATCGDGTGRNLYFIIKSWPSSDLKLIPLPIGDTELKEWASRFANKDNSELGPMERLDLWAIRFSRIEGSTPVSP